MNRSIALTGPELLAVLDEMRRHVEARDSFGGSIEYDAIGGPPCPQCGGAGITAIHGIGDEEPCDLCSGMGDEPLPPGKHFWVRAAYRVGNSEGQGGMRIIGQVSA